MDGELLHLRRGPCDTQCVVREGPRWLPGCLGEPEEIAQAAASIVECDQVTGMCIEATGGMRL